MAPLTKMEPNDTTSVTTLVIRDGDSLEFILWAIIVPILVICTFVGVVFLLIQAFRQKARLSIIYYQRALVSSGCVCVSLGGVLWISENIPVASSYIRYYKLIIYPRIFTFVVYFLYTAASCLKWNLVSISFAGYMSFCRPGCAPWITTKKATRRTILGISLFSIIFNLPRLFQTNYRHCTRYVGECYEVYVTDFGTTGFYKFFDDWITSVLLLYGPYLCAFVLNILIIRTVFSGMVFKNRKRQVWGSQKARYSLFVAVPFVILTTPVVIANLLTSSIEIRFAVGCVVFILDLLIFTLMFYCSGAMTMLKKQSKTPEKTGRKRQPTRSEDHKMKKQKHS